MPALTDAELSFMRDAIEDLLPDTCHVLSKTTTVDAIGGVVETWGTATANVACRMGYESSTYQVEGGAINTRQKLIVTVPYTTAVTPLNRIRSGTTDYAVVSVSDSRRTWPTCKRVEVRAV